MGECYHFLVVLQRLIVANQRPQAVEGSLWMVLQQFTTAKKALHCPARPKGAACPMEDGVDLFLLAAVRYIINICMFCTRASRYKYYKY